MARKKKSLKGSQESVEDPLQCMTALKPPPARSSEEEEATYHNSDSEIFDVKKKTLLQKNKSNLFIIKSYSFNDKTDVKRPKTLKRPQKLQELENCPALLPEEATSSNTSYKETKEKGKVKDKNKGKEKDKEKHKEKDKDKEKDKQKDKDKEKPLKADKMDKSSKKSKHKKLKKSKSTYDSTEDLQDFHDILRKPSLIMEEDATASSKRPLTFHADNNHKRVVKSKTMEDIDTSTHIKRESFIRHSLQSIRRSFTSSKKHHNSTSSSSAVTSAASSLTSSASSASSYSSSSSSDTPGSLKKTKTKKKDVTKDMEHMENINEEFSRAAPVANGKHHTDTCIENTPASAPHPPSVSTSSQISSSCFSAPSASPISAGLSILPEEDEKDLLNPAERSTSSVSTLAQLPPDSLTSMAPLQTHTEAHSVQCLDSIVDWDPSNTTTTKSSSSPPEQSKTSKRNALQHQLSIAESIESTSIGCATSSEYSSARSLKHSSTSLAPLQSIPSSTSLRSISPSRASSSNSSSTAKHEQSSAAATAAGAAAAAGATTSSGSTANTTPPEKEKKRKEVSSSREKKFRRYFSQVSKDEKLINYFSCALVGDILLQGHLYITDQHFAFYSNVFGYVTKVVIPTSSVTKISKEKTAKIIPNAVGVATADERHVFGSFISREAAFRLMVSVCSPLAPAEILPKDPASTEIPEVYSIEDDSSCSISGNESPAQVTENGNSSNENHHSDPSQTILRRSVGTSNLSIAESALDQQRHSDIPLNAKTATSAASLHLRASAPPAAASSHFGNGTTTSGIAGGGGGIAHMISKISSSPATAIGCATIEGNLTFIAAGSASTTTSATTTPTPSTSSSPTTVMALPHTKVYQVMTKFRTLSKKLMVNVKFPTEIHVVYLGVMLSILLAVFTIFLLYRILDIEAKTNVYRSPVEFNWQSGNDEDIFAEALRFQKQLQLKSTEEAQNILKTNLEQIAKVRRSLETLSMLIHDRSSSFGATTTDDSD